MSLFAIDNYGRSTKETKKQKNWKIDRCIYFWVLFSTGFAVEAESVVVSIFIVGSRDRLSLKNEEEIFSWRSVFWFTFSKDWVIHFFPYSYDVNVFDHVVIYFDDADDLNKTSISIRTKKLPINTRWSWSTMSTFFSTWITARTTSIK